MPKPDQEIIRRILAGEKRAFGELVDRHKDKAMTLALRMLKNREDAEEALQDAFVRAFYALPRFEWKASFSTWFYRIVYNVCATALGKKWGGVHISLDEEDEQNLDVPSEGAPPDVEYESKEFQLSVMEEVKKLPEMYAAVFTLFFVQDMSYEQIVEVTGLPPGTVKVRLFRARTMLRSAVAKRLGIRKEIAV
ncbi:MAG: sigma-70 family RNA polymerase sigma factor [Bacteroidota bacterium]